MRRACMRSWFAAVAALFLLVSGVGAAETQPYVVLIGIDKYQDAAIKPRAHAEDDVKALYDLLADQKHLKSPADHIKLLLGSADEKRKSEPATKENILKAIRWALNSATENDLVVLCWVGQGAPVGDRTCYFAVDSTLKDRAKDAVGAGDIEQEFDKVKGTRTCVLLDVHFRGYKDEKISEDGLTKRFTEYDGGKEDSDTVPKPIMLLSANDGLNPSQETEKQGLFATVVLDALRGKADTEGGEADGLVSIDELADFVRKELPARSLQLTKKEQRPIIVGRSTHFALTLNAPATGEVHVRLDKFEKLAKEAKLAEEVVKEGRALLTRMPRLEAQRELRKKYQQFADGKLALEDFQKARLAYLEGQKLSREEAEAFAKKVMNVAEIAREAYVKQIKLADLIASAVKGLYQRIDEKMPKEISERVEKIKDLNDKDLTALLIDIRLQLGNRDDLKGTKAADLARAALLHSLDNYSDFIDAKMVREFKRQTENVFIGVGIQIQKDLNRDVVRVSTPLRGSPAYKAGIRANDLILSVTNTVDEKGEPLAAPVTTPTKGLDISDVVDKILGKEGTKVKLTIEREEKDGAKTIDIEIQRGRIEVETVMGVKRNDDDSWDYYLDKSSKIGYFRLTQFSRNTERDLKSAIRDLEKQGLSGMVLDLRFNPGGYLTSAVEISDLFIDDGLIVTIKPREGRSQDFKGKHPGSLLNFPLVVLVNGGSASASEIVSAALQDHERAIVMGERSFGKGSVQNIMDLPGGNGEGPTQVKLTTASFWRPSGKNLNKFPNSTDKDEWGVLPHSDYIIKLTPSERGELRDHLRSIEIIPRRDAPKKEPEKSFVDKQLNKALEYLKGQVASKAEAK